MRRGQEHAQFRFKVIAGALKGRVITAPDLGVTRPPLTRLRRAVFDFLTPYLGSARYLDLFSGTGSYLFEAVSRGAGEAVGVELQLQLVEAINRQAELLGVEFHTIPIKGLYDEFDAELSKVWGTGKEPGLAEENLQARIRGNLIMALSNEYGWLVLTTGNKSEMAMGYCTLYGDMSGGLAVISDVPKTMVYELARYINSQAGREVIPANSINKPPSAELKPDQKDEDTLPPYSLLDPILKAYVEEDRSYLEIVGMGFDPEVVKAFLRIPISEWKKIKQDVLEVRGELSRQLYVTVQLAAEESSQLLGSR